MSRSRVRSAGLSSRVCRSSMISTARRADQDSSARAALSTESQPSGMGPRAEAKADCRWLRRVVVFASQLSARYQATGTLAEAAKPASSVLLPEPAGATTKPTRCCQMRARRASTRSRARDCTCGISTLADTTAVDPSLTLPLTRPGQPAHAAPVRCCAYPFNVLPATPSPPRSVLRHTTRTFAFVHMVIANSPVHYVTTHVCSSRASSESLVQNQKKNCTCSPTTCPGSSLDP